MHLLARVRSTIEANDHWRARTINLIASENVLSEAARSVINSDLMHRYAEGHPGQRYYEGTQYVDDIETQAMEHMCRLFKTTWADVRPISGTVANEAVFSRLVPQGATAIAHTIATGGHISHARIGSLGKRTKNILAWPMAEDGYQIDIAAARDLIAKEKPALVVFGRSLFLLPEPVEELKDVCHEHDVKVFFDGAHVLGLIAAGRFQDPLREGAHVMTGSTHKTFFGPQRGTVLASGDDKKLCKTLDKGVFPGSSSNHHLFTLPALLVSAIEMEEFGEAYADAILANSQALGAALDKAGLPAALPEHGYSKSHQVAVDVSKYGGGRDVGKRLCQHEIVCNMNLLPGEPMKNVMNPKGIRLGVQEMTRFGMGPAEMGHIAELIHEAVKGDKDVRPQVTMLRRKFNTVRYGYSSADMDV